jgi:hypothetical protein
MKFLLALPFVVGALAVAGCGNYSNEDLEFMNALPKQSDLSVNMPARTSAVTVLEEAELARLTHETTRGLNGLTRTLVGLVDLIRSYPPTSRTRVSRVWGPFGAGPNETKNLDWQRRMIMTRDALDPNVFDFEIAVHKIGAADTDWPVFIRGSFDAGKTARQGSGHLEVITVDVRAEGLDLTDWNKVDHLEIDYKAPVPAPASDPIHIAIKLTNLDPTPNDAMPAPTMTYDYQATDEGQGQMTFDLFANSVPVMGPVDQTEHLNITSLWLPSGEGRAQETIVSGDGVGAHQSECWDRSFKPTFDDLPFAMPPKQSGDQSICPMITALSAPAF